MYTLPWWALSLIALLAAVLYGVFVALLFWFCCREVLFVPPIDRVERARWIREQQVRRGEPVDSVEMVDETTT